VSKTYEALRRAEKARVFTTSDTRGPRSTPDIEWNLDPAREVEYQRIRVWLTGSASRGRAVKTVMVVSCHSGTGTTTTAALLAATLTEGSRLRVLIVDSNFRTPALGRVFNVRSGDGLSNVVEEGLPLETGMRATERSNLSVLPTGRIARFPGEVFEGDAIDQTIGILKEQFDFVIFDAAPVLEFPDAYALAPKVDAVILVVGAERTSVDDAQRAKRAIEEAGGHVVGVILNRQRDYTPRLLKRLFGRLT
jgi:capsular exopolysaccharide synthesis family protein